MHIFPVTVKPVEPTGTFNGLFSAVVAGTTRGEFEGQLSFMDAAGATNPDASLRGPLNSGYTEMHRLWELDPTSPLATSIRSSYIRTPTSSTGYTSEFTALEYIAAISAQFASWLREYLVIYELAKKAEMALAGGSYQVLDEELDLRYGEGHVAAYYAAVGDFNSSLIAYPATQPLSVEAVHSKVMAALQQYAQVLDNQGYTVAEDYIKQYYGLGSIPTSGVPVAFLSSNTVDRLYRSPWARLLKIERARDLLMPQLMERYELAASAASGGYVGITEGDDVTLLPAGLTETQILEALDGVDSVDYSNGSFWTNQFFTKGSVVGRILDGSINLLAGHNDMCVMTAPLDPVSELVDHSFLPDTGPLSSYNSLNDVATAYNFIHGSTMIRDGRSIAGGAISGDDMFCPNGIMYLGVCGEASAVDWIRILKSLDLYLPTMTKTLLDITGRSKRTFPTGTPTVSSSDALIAELSANGQRDGFINMPMMAFNTGRSARDEQEGPIFAGSTDDNLGGAEAGSQSTYGMWGLNGWDRTDTSEGKYLLDTYGQEFNLNVGIPARFTGEWDAGRYSVWQTDLITESIAAGASTVDVRIAENLLSLPGVRSGRTGFSPRSSPNASSFYSVLGNMDDEVDFIYGGPGSVRENLTLQMHAGDYNGTTAFESFHPTRGFMRGLATYVSPQIHSSVIPPAGGNAAAVDDTSPRFPLASSAHVPTASGLRQYSGARKTLAGYNAGGIAPHGNTWMWDPTRATILGNSWFRWAGHQMTGALPHPYCPHPVATFTSAAHLSDLIALGSMAESPTGYYVVGGIGSNASGSSDLTQQVLFGQGASDLDDGEHVTNHERNRNIDLVVPSGRSLSNAAVLGESVTSALSLELNAKPNGDPINHLSHTLGLPAIDLMLPVVNGCSRKNFCHSTGHSLNNMYDLPGTALGARRSNPAALTGLVGTGVGITSYYGNLHTRAGVNSFLLANYEGEVLTPCAIGAWNAQRLTASVVIDGVGFNFTQDLMSHSVLDAPGWMKSVFTDSVSPMRNRATNVWPSLNGTGGLDTVEAPHVGINHIAGGLSPNLLATSGIGQDAFTTVADNDWFRKGPALSGRHARMRKRTLANPWVRGVGEAGILNLQYSSEALGPIFDTVHRKARDLGASFQRGLTNAKFLELHQAN